MPICPVAEDYDDARYITLNEYLESVKKYNKESILLFSTMFPKYEDLFIEWYRNGYTERIEKFFTKFYFLKKRNNVLEKKSKKWKKNTTIIWSLWKNEKKKW